jgi:hypothetical protein
METPLNEKESLAIIGSMIAGTRRKLSHDSVHYLLWGWSVLLAALAHFALLQASYEHHYLPWAILMPATGIAAAVIGSRQAKQSTVKTHIDTAMTYLWLGFLVLLLLVLVASVKMGWENSYPLIMWLYGLGTFVSGGILKFKPLIYGGIASWILGAFAIFMPFEQQLLLLAAAIVCSYIVPGHLLKASKDA